MSKMIFFFIFFMLSFSDSCSAESAWTTYTTENSGLVTNSILSVAVDNDGSVWLGGLGGGFLILIDKFGTQISLKNAIIISMTSQ